MGLSLARVSREILYEYDDKKYESFLDDVIEKGLKESCVKRGILMSAALNWIRADKERNEAYERALEVASEVHAHEVVPLADSVGDDPTKVPGAKLKIETRLRLASKWNRGRYGDKQDVTVGGSLSLITLLSSLPKSQSVEVEDAEVLPNPVKLEKLDG